jgi:ribonuclease Z
MVKCIVIGSGSPRLSLERAGACYLALVGEVGRERGLLFDCGPGSTLRLFQGGYRSQVVDHLFLTHHHYDHLADLGHFALTRWDHTPCPTPLRVHGPAGTGRIAEALFGAGGVYENDTRIRTEHPMGQRIFARRGGQGPRPKPEVVARDVVLGPVAGGEGWSVEAGPASHAQPVAECYSYRLDAGGRGVVFSGDTGECAGLVELARGADTLVHMCCFLEEELEGLGIGPSVAGPVIAGRAAAGAGVRKLVLTHPQSEALDTPSGLAGAVATAARHFDGEIVFARDLLEL